MPIKWDSRLNEFLLVQILELKNVNVNTKDAEQIAQAWPAALGEKPTPRAITEHIFKMKKEAAATGGGKTNATPKRAKTSIPIRSGPVTPSKRSAPKASSDSRSKRQRKNSDIESDDDASPAPAPTPRISRVRRAASLRVNELIRKAYASDSNEVDEDEQEEEDMIDDGEDSKFQEEKQDQVLEMEEPVEHVPGEIEELLDEAAQRHEEEAVVKTETDWLEEA